MSFSEIDPEAKCIGIGSDSWVWEENKRVVKQFDFNSFRVGGDKLSELSPEAASLKIIREHNIIKSIHRMITNELVKSHIVQTENIRYRKLTKLPVAIEMEKLHSIDIENMLEILAVPDALLELSTQLINTMINVHTKAFVAHLDLKPFNCVIEVLPNGKLRLVIVDWGNAILIDSQGCGNPSSLGTLAYRSPEILNLSPFEEKHEDLVCDKMDIWACGCILLDWLIAGQHIECKVDRFQDMKQIRKWWNVTYPQTILPRLEKLTTSGETHLNLKKVAQFIIDMLEYDPTRRHFPKQ